MLISDLATEIDNFTETRNKIKLGELRLAEDGFFLREEEGFFPADELAMNHIAKFLKINESYLSKCPFSLQRENINYWLANNSETEAVFLTVENQLRAVYSPNKKILPVDRILDIISRVFSPEDEVKAFNIDESLINIDVVSLNNLIEVPGLGTDERPEVGDITHGGIRTLVYPYRDKAPEMESYFNRLWCSNGASSPQTEHKIKLRGNTVEDILSEMEDKAQILLDELPIRLDEYKKTSEIAAPSNLAQFIFQVGAEADLPQRIIRHVMDSIGTLPAEPTVYDVMQLFTAVANQPVTWRNRLKLQHIGGEFITNTQKILHRCSSCERII